MAIKQFEEVATSFEKFKTADAALVELVRRVVGNIQRNRSSRELYGASKGLRKILNLIEKTLKKAYPGIKLVVYTQTGSHDIEGTVAIDEDEDQPNGVPDLGININIDGNWGGDIWITVYANGKRKDVKAKGAKVQEGMLLQALTLLNSLIAKKRSS